MKKSFLIAPMILCFSLAACAKKQDQGSSLLDSTTNLSDLTLTESAVKQLFAEVNAQSSEGTAVMPCASFGAVTSSGTSCSFKMLYCSATNDQAWIKRMDDSVRAVQTAGAACKQLKSSGAMIEGDANGVGKYYLLRDVSLSVSKTLNNGQVTSETFSGFGKMRKKSSDPQSGSLTITGKNAKTFFELLQSVNQANSQAVSCVAFGAVTSAGTSCRAKTLYCSETSIGGFIEGLDGSFKKLTFGMANFFCEEMAATVPLVMLSDGSKYRVLKDVRAGVLTTLTIDGQILSEEYDVTGNY